MRMPGHLSTYSRPRSGKAGDAPSHAFLRTTVCVSLVWLVACDDSIDPVPPRPDAGAEGGADTGSDAATQNDATLDASDGAVEASPAAGELGGSCYGNSTCNAGLSCDDAGLCVVSPVNDGGGGEGASDAPAAAGTLGGACYGNNTCNAGLTCTDAGQCDVPMTYCGTHPNKALPYDIATDFNQVLTLGKTTAGLALAGTSIDFTSVANPDCVGSTYPPIPDAGAKINGPMPEAGAGGAGSDAMSDASAADASAEAGGDGAAGSTEAGPTDGGPPACFEFLYNPICDYLTPGSAAVCYGGVIFQSAPTNAGPGVCIAPGATKVTFSARASRNNAVFKFGSIRAGVGSTEFYLNVTTQWAQYSVGIPANVDYNSTATSGGVWNGFSVVAEGPNHLGGTYIQIKDIVWTM